MTPAAVSAATAIAVWIVLTILQPFLRPGIARFLRMTESGASTSTLRIPDAFSMANVLSEDQAVVALVKNAQPAVVAVIVKSSVPPAALSVGPSVFDPFNPIQPSVPPKSQKGRKQQVGSGSGFFVSSDGLIVTNKHVVDFEDPEFEIILSDGRKLPANVLGTDPLLDIAFLRVEGSGFPTLAFEDSDALEPGQTVIAIGNALDQFRNTVTKGIVSGLNRSIYAGDGVTTELIEEAVQTDAAINPGNSGGPLLSLSGKVVGLNTAVSESGQLIGFALPSNTVRRDLESILKFGKIARPFLGVRYQMITEDIVQKNQLKIDHGALIVRGEDQSELAVSPGSPADKAGLVENDIIIKVDGMNVTEEHSLKSLIGRHAPGDPVTLTVLHAGTEKTVTVTLEELK